MAHPSANVCTGKPWAGHREQALPGSDSVTSAKCQALHMEASDHSVVVLRACRNLQPSQRMEYTPAPLALICFRRPWPGAQVSLQRHAVVFGSLGTPAAAPGATYADRHASQR